MISRIRSKGWSDDSSRRPITRVSRSRNAKTTTARRTMSIQGLTGRSCSSGRCGGGAWDVTQLEREPAVVGAFAERARLDRVDGHAFDPAGIEDQDRVLDVSVGDDVKPRREEQPTAKVGGRIELQICRRARRECGLGPLAEDVE